MHAGIVLSIISMLIMISPGMLLANESRDVYGAWINEAGSAHIEIETCEQGVCGKIVWLNPDSLDAGKTAETVKDIHNKDPQLTQRNLLGMTMLWGFEPSRNGWKGGSIYDPESGKTYSSKVIRLNNETLQVKGCISLFCQSQIWTKVPPKN